MLAKGNGDARVCARNLFSMQEYECTLIRDLGLDARILDRPGNVAMVIHDAQKKLAAFEPRLTNTDIRVNEVADGYEIEVRNGQT